MPSKPKFRKKQFNKRLVLVSWRDTRSDSRWREVDEHLPHADVESVGWLVASTRSHITVAASLIEHNEEETDITIGDVTTIPRGCVKDVKDLK